MPFSQWDSVSQTALIWSKQLLSGTGLTNAPPPGLWYQASNNDPLIRAALSRHRIIPPAAAWLANNSDALIPAETQKWLVAERVINQRQVIAHVAAAARIQQVLLDADVKVLFIKGPFQAKQATGDPAGRGSGDIDLLIEPEKFDQALEVLLSAGAVMMDKQLDARLAEKVSRVHHAAALEMSGIPIDSHRRLDPNPDRMQLGFDELWRERDTVQLAGVNFSTLSPIDACILTASHGCRDNWLQIRQLIDFAQSLNRVQSAGSDIRALEQRAKKHAVTRALAIALAVAQILVPELPAQSASAQYFAKWTWSRYRSGRVDVGARTPRNTISRFAYSTLTEEGFHGFVYAARRLTWFTATNVDPLIPQQSMWAYPLIAPVNVVRRMIKTEDTLHKTDFSHLNSVDFARRELLLLMIAMDTQPFGAKEAWDQWRILVPDFNGVTATEISLLPAAWRKALAAGATDPDSGRLQGLQRRASMNATAIIAGAESVQQSLLQRGIRSEITGGAAAALMYTNLSRWPLPQAELWIDRKNRDAAIAPDTASELGRIIGRHQLSIGWASGKSIPITLAWRQVDRSLKESHFCETREIQWQGRKLLVTAPAVTAMDILIKTLSTSRPGVSDSLVALFDVHLLSQDPNFNRDFFLHLRRTSKFSGIISSHARSCIKILPKDLAGLLMDSSEIFGGDKSPTKRTPSQMGQDFMAQSFPRISHIVIRTLS